MSLASPKNRGVARRRFPGWVSIAAVAVAALAVAALVLWNSIAGSEWRVHADADDRELVELGRSVYAEHCAACHGAELEGQVDWRTRLPDGTLPAPPHDETGHTWHHPDAQLFEIVKEGGQAAAPAGYRSAMPAFSGVLSNREIIASLAYIKSRWPTTVRRRQDQINSRSQ